MRMLARVRIPVDAGNQALQSGALPKVIQQFAERWHPEAMYFTALDGKRTALVVFDMPDSSALPPFAEPFFSELHAEVELSPVMNGEDLQNGLSQLS